jgi:protein-S-isoprenylcysteine O-methyltransferase Ste14
MTAIGWIVHRRNPGLFPARAHWRHADTKPFDKIILPLFFFLTILLPTFAGLDVRFHRPSFPFRTVYPALVLSLCAMSLIGWTMVTNPWAESSVRIQTDRGQQVVGSGPYRFVRHPLYLGCMVLYSASAVIFGGFDALLVALILDGLIVLRTELEDRTLQRELSGYQQYAGITRWRLLPGIW